MKWSNQIEEELGLLLKDWLKAQQRTQADLRKVLNADSTRMPSIIEALKKEYIKGGLQEVASCLCRVEESWSQNDQANTEEVLQEEKSLVNPFDQLDLLLEKIREDCES